MAIMVSSTPEQRTCRGKAGKSKPHLHYPGRGQASTREGWVTRCTSCTQIVMLRRDAKSQGYQLVPAADLQRVALIVMNSIL